MDIIEENKLAKETLTVEENKTEGLFGNFPNSDEIFGENGSEPNDDPMDVSISEEKQKNEKNRMDIFEFTDDINKDPEQNIDIENNNAVKLAETADTDKQIAENAENVENKNENGGEFADDEEENDNMETGNHDFVVGDFVWGKIKSHPWWPGQIYDPSDASDFANSQKRKGALLVAYFGDGSFSWCFPSQLKPFIENFQEMSNQSDSKKFVNAVQKAMEAVSRLVAAELTCKCDASFDLSGFSGLSNSGIKDGVAVPKGNTVRVLMDRLQPFELVTKLKDSATMEPGTRLVKLEFTVLKSYLSVFYRRKGGYSLVEYYDSKCIEGLEDKSKSASLSDSDVNGSTENGEDKLYQKRKKKSVAELLGDDEVKTKKMKTAKNGGLGTRKRKPLTVSVTDESDHESGGGGGGVEEETMSPRQRKKSKYLSPPYLSPVGIGKGSILGSGSNSFKEPKPESENVLETAREEVETSLKTSTGKKSRSHKSRLREMSDSKDSDDKPIDATVDVQTVLHGLLRAAFDPTSFSEKTLPEISDFVSSFRRSVFVETASTAPDGKKDSITTLVIEFPPEASLPTKSDLVKTYKKSGDLIKKQTRTTDTTAFVVFRNESDAESALAMSLEKKPFGDVTYRVLDKAVSKTKTSSTNVAAEDSSGLEFIAQKVETMSEMVHGCEESEMSADVKASLEEGLKAVLDKVRDMRAK